MRVDVDAVLVAYHSDTSLVSACESASAAGARRLIVVDNSPESGDGAAVGRRFSDATVLESEGNVGFARGVNRGVELSRAPLVLLLNPDARLEPDGLEHLAGALEEVPDAAAAGPMIRRPDGSLELSVDRTMSPLGDVAIKLLETLYARGTGPARSWIEARYARSRDARSLSAACLLLRREAFEEVGGFDERFFLYAEDVDLCLRLRRAGWRLRYAPEAVARHVGGLSGRPDPEAVERAWRRSQALFYAKHHPRALPLLRAWVRLRYRVAAWLGTPDRRRRAARILASLQDPPP